ncbi:MAG: DUF2997 domain-containing protein [Dehalococcoidia bacterium]|nr:DUF2997 domain-containing protein [Dehalococcoidia bacterium]
MKEIQFEIDTATGELKAHVQGEAGRACLDVHRLVEELVGQPNETVHTREFYQQVLPQEQTRVKR